MGGRRRGKKKKGISGKNYEKVRGSGKNAIKRRKTWEKVVIDIKIDSRSQREERYSARE